MWLNPADDFPGLRDASEGPVKPLQGIGDEAFLRIDEDSKRYWPTAVKRGKVTIQISGDRADWVEAVARVRRLRTLASEPS